MPGFLRSGTASNAEERPPVYAVIRTGGKHYRVSTGDKLRIERLNAEVGDVIDFDQVLLVGAGSDIRVGAPLVPGGIVQGKVLDQGRGKKIDIVKFKRRAHYRRTGGHRQHYTEVEITSISGGEAA
jgi:large subunit ribosomal protein L21